MPATPADFGFSPDELTPLGTFFGNDFRFQVVDTVNAFQVRPPANAVRGNVAVWTCVALVFVGFYWLFDRVWVGEGRGFALGFVVILGVATVAGGFAIGLARQRHLERRGPVIDYDKAARRLRIVGGHTFDHDEVVGLLCTCIFHNAAESGRLAELVLIAVAKGKRQRFLLMTQSDSRPGAFDYIAVPFVAKTGLAAYRVWNQGLTGRGPLAAERIEFDHLSV